MAHSISVKSLTMWCKNKSWKLHILYGQCQFNKIDRMPTSITYFRQINFLS